MRHRGVLEISPSMTRTQSVYLCIRTDVRIMLCVCVCVCVQTMVGPGIVTQYFKCRVGLNLLLR